MPPLNTLTHGSVDFWAGLSKVLAGIKDQDSGEIGVRIKPAAMYDVFVNLEKKLLNAGMLILVRL